MPADREPHPAVAAVLAATPLFDGQAVHELVDLEVDEGTYEAPRLGPAEPIAARQAVEGHREIVASLRHALTGAWKDMTPGQRDGVDHVIAYLDHRADHIEDRYRTSTEGEPT